MTPRIITGSVLWTPGAEHVLDLSAPAGNAPVLEFPALVPVDLTESHGINITLQRLIEMAGAYDPAVEMASLNLDHNWGGPSLGRCERVWVQDAALWVRYVDLDPATVELIRSKRYTRRSAEIALSHPITGGWYFTGCALLGNARPAIPGLPPVTLCRPQYVLTARKETPVPEDDSSAPATPPPDPPTAPDPSPPPDTPSWPPCEPRSPKARRPSRRSSDSAPSSTPTAGLPSSAPASPPPWRSLPGRSSSSCSPSATPPPSSCKPIRRSQPSMSRSPTRSFRSSPRFPPSKL